MRNNTKENLISEVFSNENKVIANKNTISLQLSKKRIDLSQNLNIAIKNETESLLSRSTKSVIKSLKMSFSMILLLVFPGCGVTNIVDSPTIEEGKGIMLVNIASNRVGYKIAIINRNNLTVSSAIFKIDSRESLRAISLPAGEYFWRGIYVGNSYSQFGRKFKFKIEPNEINYVGDLVINMAPSLSSYDLSIRDNFEVVDQLFKKRYPKLSKNKSTVKNVTTKKEKKVKM